MTLPQDTRLRRAASDAAHGRPHAERDGSAASVLRLALALALMLLLLWIAGRILLIIFAGVLFGVLLHGLSRWLADRSFLSDGWALAAVTLALLVVAGLGALYLAPNIAGQLDALGNSLATFGESLQHYLSRYGWGRSLLETWSPQELASNFGGVLNRMVGVASTVLWVVGMVAIILFIGFYTAAEPRLYEHGLVRLFPPHYRRRAAEILHETGHTLRLWLLGRAASMLAVGVMATVGLWLLGIPLALTLGLLAGLLDFIPNIGPIAAGALAILVALAQDPSRALYVLLLYIAIQALEGYLLTPLIQKRVVSLPPALLLSAQILLGLFFGIIGLTLATPIAAAGLVIVRMAFVEDVLGDRSAGGPAEG